MNLEAPIEIEESDLDTWWMNLELGTKKEIWELYNVKKEP